MGTITEEVIGLFSVLDESTGNVCTIGVNMAEEAIQGSVELVDEERQVVIFESGLKFECEVNGIKGCVTKRLNGVEVSKLGLKSDVFTPISLLATGF